MAIFMRFICLLGVLTYHALAAQVLYTARCEVGFCRTLHAKGELVNDEVQLVAQQMRPRSRGKYVAMLVGGSRNSIAHLEIFCVHPLRTQKQAKEAIADMKFHVGFITRGYNSPYPSPPKSPSDSGSSPPASPETELPIPGPVLGSPPGSSTPPGSSSPGSPPGSKSPPHRGPWPSPGHRTPKGPPTLKPPYSPPSPHHRVPGSPDSSDY